MVLINILTAGYRNYSIWLFFLLLFTGILHAQISPGDLVKTHSKFEGMSNCTKCHVLGQGVENSKCLDCHKEIKTLMDAGRGYHSSSDVRGKNCWSCHSDHHGRNFRIINFDEKNFDHNRAGFKLSGKHSSIKCQDCHTKKFISPEAYGRNNNTYLGLSENCFSCHEDVHQGTLSINCGNCHDTKSFKPASKFDHDSTKYKLTGAHQKIECIKCHEKEIKNGKEFQKFSGLFFNNCSPCHKDVHNGRFGEDCQKCHVTTNFKAINEKRFDHNKTAYPLLGRHRFVKCEDCHKRGLNVKLKFQKCTDCHSDFHKGDFTVNHFVRDCSDCHAVQGFQPSLFTIEKHNQLKFKLIGSHLAVPCRNCHFENKEWDFKNIGEKCIDCHKNVHGSEITNKFMPNNNCSTCHQTESWFTISFDHNKTTFPLKGKHEKVKCGDCHHRVNDTGIRGYKFLTLTTYCETCHKDVHYGQFKQGKTSNCQRCHSYDNWKALGFNHEKTKFSLKGAHEKLKCSACHKEVHENGNVFIQYKLKDFKCAACHA